VVPVKQWIGLVARLIVAGFLLVAGWIKFQDPAGTVRSVRAYRILPEAVVPTVGHALPMLEFVLGALLLLGLFTRVAGLLSGLFFLAFIFGISSAWIRGMEINCGCFGNGGVPANPQRQYAIEIARDTGLLLCSLWLVIWPRTHLSLDKLLFRKYERLLDGDGSEEAVEV
jgi:uncharacterized membrane protein YphA (DoxX/SURF4 family)